MRRSLAATSFLCAEVRVITDVIVKAAGTKGQGVFAQRDFTPGEVIFRRRYGRSVRLIHTVDESRRM